MATNDFCTREGALRLKERIEAYWKERGYDVNIELTEAGFMPAMRSARTDVRSNMVNGMPRRRIAKTSDELRTSYRPDNAVEAA